MGRHFPDNSIEFLVLQILALFIVYFLLLRASARARTHTHTHTHTYIYIYIKTKEKKPQKNLDLYDLNFVENEE